MSLREIRDWLLNLNAKALDKPAFVLIDGKIYKINNWRIGGIKDANTIEPLTAEIIWDC